MQSVIIDIVDEGAMRLLKDMELLKLIRVRKEKSQVSARRKSIRKYDGILKNDISDITKINNQLNELRNAWE